MKTHLSKREIKKVYSAIKNLAEESFLKGDINKSLSYIKHCTVLAQQFNWIYSDEDLETLLQGIGEELIPDQANSFSPIAGRVVFYDDFCTSFVLALQYMRALVSAGNDILYITPKKERGDGRFDGIIPEISSYPKVQVVSLPKGTNAENARFIYQTVLDFQPEKVLLHMKAYSVSLPALYRLPNSIDRYIINLADQTFWLGSKAIDYSLEFRHFGATVSNQRRGLKDNQLLLVPFYPITDRYRFDGYPTECTPDKVVIFSGGDLYKVIDKDRTYWKLVKKILDLHPQVVFLFATKISKDGNEIIEQFIKQNHFEGRFIYIGFRKDINEVFKHCDIYMGTCPASGSLMSQLAAINQKPILQYYLPGTPDDETEQAICYNEQFSISYDSEQSFLQEAKRLIESLEYRDKQGARLKKAMIKEEQFNKLVKDTLTSNHSQLRIEWKSFSYSCLDKRWFELEQLQYVDTLPYVSGILGKKKCLIKIPMLILKKYLRII